jgi:hypothetical protein
MLLTLLCVLIHQFQLHVIGPLSLIFHFDYFRTYLVIILKALVKMLFLQNLGLKVYPLKILSRIYTSAK